MSHPGMAIASYPCGHRVQSGARTHGLCPQCLMKWVIESGRRSAEPWIAPAASELRGLFPSLDIESLIGQGGMGAVYRATQPQLNRRVAVKILPFNSASDPELLERFRREARVLASLSHPGIVVVHEFLESSSLCALVMELVEGPSLRERLVRGPIPPADARDIASQLCDALDYAHRQAVLHRDVKPDNVLLRPVSGGTRACLVDFGLTRPLSSDAATWSLTQTGQAVGTMYYMAPEQIENDPRVDARADIYALGVVLHEMLTGHPPAGAIARPSDYAAPARRLGRIALRCMQRDPDRRFQSAAELSAALDRCKRQPAVQARRLIMLACIAAAVAAPLQWRWAHSPDGSPRIAAWTPARAASQPSTQSASQLAAPSPAPPVAPVVAEPPLVALGANAGLPPWLTAAREALSDETGIQVGDLRTVFTDLDRRDFTFDVVYGYADSQRDERAVTLIGIGENQHHGGWIDNSICVRIHSPGHGGQALLLTPRNQIQMPVLGKCLQPDALCMLRIQKHGDALTFALDPAYDGVKFVPIAPKTIPDLPSVATFFNGRNGTLFIEAHCTIKAVRLLIDGKPADVPRHAP